MAFRILDKMEAEPDEVATIITRMADPSLRKSFTLSAPGINDDLTFRLASDGSGYLVTACKQDVKTVTIPVSYNGLPVIGIAPGTFKDCQSLNSITVSGPSKYLYAEDGVVFSNLPEKTLLCFPPAYNIANYYYVPDGVKVTVPGRTSTSLSWSRYKPLPEMI